MIESSIDGTRPRDSVVMPTRNEAAAATGVRPVARRRGARVPATTACPTARTHRVGVSERSDDGSRET